MSYYVMNTSSGPSLFDNTEPASSHRRTFINPTLWFDDCDGYRVVFCRHEVLYRVALGDPLHLALVAVTLRQSKLATQAEIAAAFGHSVATQRRWETRYSQHSTAGLQAKTPTGRPGKLGRGQQVFIERWFRQGVSNHEMARRLAVSEATIRRALRKAGLRRQTTPPAQLPLAADAPAPGTWKFKINPDEKGVTVWQGQKAMPPVRAAMSFIVSCSAVLLFLFTPAASIGYTATCAFISWLETFSTAWV